MKKFFVLALLIMTGVASKAQLNPVSWTFTSKKIADKTFELRLAASIQDGWHLYSQSQPQDAIAEPTKITFNKNPLLTVDGKIKEEGKMEKFHDAKLDLSANQYSSRVIFIQTVKLKTDAKTKVSGSVRFQTCNDEKCLPPKSVTFSVAL
ncbi:MAG: protein-disulfide reductase DsbD family protein [Bacteroidota bacterium]|nr:protein-disulfide reductase DsbD family protein [Bacteroidota bacterium]